MAQALAQALALTLALALAPVLALASGSGSGSGSGFWLWLLALAQALAQARALVLAFGSGSGSGSDSGSGSGSGFSSRYGEKWVEKLKSSFSLLELCCITDLIRFMMKEAENLMKGSVHEDDFFIVHDALVLMKAKARSRALA